MPPPIHIEYRLLLLASLTCYRVFGDSRVVSGYQKLAEEQALIDRLLHTRDNSQHEIYDSRVRPRGRLSIKSPHGADQAWPLPDEDVDEDWFLGAPYPGGA